MQAAKVLDLDGNINKAVGRLCAGTSVVSSINTTERQSMEAELAACIVHSLLPMTVVESVNKELIKDFRKAAGKAGLRCVSRSTGSFFEQHQPSSCHRQLDHKAI